MPSLDDLLRSPRLPTPPAVAVKVLDLTRRPDADIKAIVQVVRTDSALTAKILRTVNSSVYGLRHTVTSIEQAAALLGGLTIGSLALGFALVPQSLGHDPRKVAFHRKHWRASLVQAISADSFSKLIGRGDPTEYFVAGLLKDIGRLVLVQLLGERYLDLWEAASARDLPLVYLETEELGHDHLALGARLLERWSLAASICQAVGACGTAAGASAELYGEVAELRDALLTAEAVTELLCGRSTHAVREQLCALCERHYELTGPAVDRLVHRIEARVVETERLFDFELEPLRSYDQILEEASTQLVERTMRAHEQTRATAERAQQAEAEREHYRRQALLDPLTGAYNQVYLLATLEREYLRCARYGDSLGLLFIDLDGFKAINDELGHHVGDRILRRVTRALLDTLRDSDVLARYGGDEFVVLLLRPGAQDIEWVAERVRRAIEAAEIEHAGRTVAVTASIGCAFASPRRGARNPLRLVVGADQAMYEAKREGGNRTCIEAPPPSSVQL